MKILMTTDTVGGVWTYALELIRSLSDRGVSFALATMGAPMSASQRSDAESLDIEIFESSYKLEWMLDPWSDVDAAGRWLLYIERCVRPDLVHLNGYAHGALPWQAPVIVVAHSCVCSWWEAVKHEPAPSTWNTYRQRVRQGVRAADHVVAPSASMLDALQRHYGHLPKGSVIYNARDPQQFSPATKSNVIFSAGRFWDEAKNLSTLDRAAARLPWPVRVAGSIAAPDGAITTPSNAIALGVLDQSQIAAELAAASIYAMPARYEPFGLSILEAAISGCSLVLGDIPSLRELWADAALFVAPDDANALATAIESLIDDPRRRLELADRARRVSRLYHPARMAEGYASLYQQLNRRRAAPVRLAAPSGIITQPLPG